jgi:hypothetical protein
MSITAPQDDLLVPQDVVQTMPEADLVVYANRLFRDVGRLERQVEVLKAALTQEVSTMTAAYMDTARPLVDRAGRLRLELEQVVQYLPLYGKRSRTLPAGSFKFRKAGGKIEVVDGEKLKSALNRLLDDKTLDLLYPEKPRELSKSMLNKFVTVVARTTEDGEVVRDVILEGEALPGLTVEPEYDKLTIEPSLADAIALGIHERPAAAATLSHDTE